MKLNKPLYSFSLSDKLHDTRLNDIFLGLTINCEFIISVTSEQLDTENFYIHSYSNLYLNFNTTPLNGSPMTVFHQIHLGQFQQSLIHIHFYQNVVNPDLFVFLITEMDCEILVILFGNLPRLHCSKCQSKSCDRHGLIAKQSYQLPLSQLNYTDKFHQVITIYHQDQTLVIVIGDCECNIRFITMQFVDNLHCVQHCKYPKSMFPFSVSLFNNKIIENECSCFFDNVDINEKCRQARLRPLRSSIQDKCQLCLTKSTVTIVNDNQCECNCHQELPEEIINRSHTVSQKTPINSTKFNRVLLMERESVLTCRPCNKKSFLNDIGASYQSLILCKHNSSFANFDYDSIHGEILGSSNADGSNSYQWVTDGAGATIETTKLATIVTEELVINSGSWFPDMQSEVVIHCLGMATGKLSFRKTLLVHVMDESRRVSYLVELDIDTGVSKVILQESTSLEFCKFVKDVQICCRQWILDLNNDVQVATGNSLQSITDYSGLIELKH